VSFSAWRWLLFSKGGWEQERNLNGLSINNRGSKKSFSFGMILLLFCFGRVLSSRYGKGCWKKKKKTKKVYKIKIKKGKR